MKNIIITEDDAEKIFTDLFKQFVGRNPSNKEIKEWLQKLEAKAIVTEGMVAVHK